MTDKNTFRSDRIISYFQKEWRVLLVVTISGLIYNLGLLAGPWFEGQLTEKERRKWFGYVEQSYHMVPGTIRDQITLYDESITEEQSWQNRRSCFWMRLLQTWMPRRNTRCCRH